MESSQSIALQPGDRVKVLVSTEKRDPWLTPKEGWEGVAVAPATNMEATHWQIRFVEPWCSLGISRIMPLSSLAVVSAVAPQEATKEEPVPETCGPAQIELSDVAEMALVEEEVDIEDVPAEEDGMEPCENPEDDVEPIPEPQKSPKGTAREFSIGAQFRVKDQAGDSSGEEHISRRRGQVGTVCRICELATSCVELEFGDGGRPVMIPKSYLSPTKLSPEIAQPAQKIIKAKTQMKLPF